MQMGIREPRTQKYIGFSNKDFREGLVIGKAYKIKSPVGRDDCNAEYITAKLIEIYPTYALFDTGKYLSGPQHFDLAHGGMKQRRADICKY